MHPLGHHGRDVECAAAAQAAFLELAERIEAMGWTADEAAATLLGLATSHVAARLVQTEVERAIRRAKLRAVAA
jgi:hypothetical protein